MSISVIVPCYNHAKYVAFALEAIFAQTVQPNEIIVIDDASTDGSLAVIEQVTLSHPEVRIIRRTERGGAVGGMNQGLALATGEYVALLAADDYVSPRFLELSTAMLDQHREAAFVSACVELRNDDGRALGQRPIMRPSLSARYFSPDDVRALLIQGDNFFLGMATLYRKRCLDELGGFDFALGAAADSTMQRRLAVRHGVCFRPELLAVWRIHGLNYSTSSATNTQVLEQMIEANMRTLRAEPQGLFPAGYDGVFMRRLRFNAARLMAAGLPDRPEAVDQIVACIKAGAPEAGLLYGLGRAGKLAPILVTAWLALRLRPFSFRWLAREWAARQLLPRGRLLTS